jgi:HK97 family phage major capsid protein
MYGADPQDGPAAGAPRALEGFPVHWSLYPAATAASAKDIYFGNWNFVGMREEPALRFIRDPFSVDGIVVLKYSFRTVYGVLIAGAVGYGVHPSA